jgi:N-acetylmuramoyl-L-alanine amidase
MRLRVTALVMVACVTLATPVEALPRSVRADAMARRESVVKVGSLRPPIVRDLIPFGRRRKREMGRYSKRHYGTWGWRLKRPQVIVEHYTDGTSYSGAWATMASNSRHLGELPGTCSHFVIDKDGTIYMLVPPDVRCRHAVGMNYTAFGIEHVGTSDRMVLHNRRQMRSSLRLTVWLMARFHVNIGNVVGHNETLHSPYRHELYPSWKCLVHADFPHWAMRRYRHRLRDLADTRGVRTGAGPVWVGNGC